MLIERIFDLKFHHPAAIRELADHPHRFDGGAHEPLSRKDLEDKFVLNARHGGYDAARAQAALKLASNVFGGRIDLSALRG